MWLEKGGEEGRKSVREWGLTLFFGICAAKIEVCGRLAAAITHHLRYRTSLTKMETVAVLIATAAIIAVGTIDEKGFIANLLRKGLNILLSISEIVANCIDARASRILFHNDGTYIRIIDDGLGMDEEGIRRMFDMYRQNHSNEKSMGVSGFGAKAALYIMSNKKNMKLYTKLAGGAHYVVDIPWADIQRTGKYTGMITIRNMDAAEIAKFNAERQGAQTGTTIEIPYYAALYNALCDQFTFEGRSAIKPEERMDCIFGKTGANMTLKDQNKEQVKLALYNYFSGNDDDFYTGVSRSPIKQYKVGDETRYVLEMNGRSYVCKKSGTGYSKTIVEMDAAYLRNAEYVGGYSVNLGMKKNRRLFDARGKLNRTAEAHIHETEEDYFEDNEKSLRYLSKCGLVRNGQLIGRFQLPGLKFSSARGNFESRMKAIDLRAELSYEIDSRVDNEIDITVGIQENKNQHNGDHLPTPLVRLIEYARDAKYKVIMDHLNDLEEEAEEEVEESAEEEVESEEEEVQSAEEEVESEEEEVESEEESSTETQLPMETANTNESSSTQSSTNTSAESTPIVQTEETAAPPTLSTSVTHVGPQVRLTPKSYADIVAVFQQETFTRESIALAAERASHRTANGLTELFRKAIELKDLIESIKNGIV